MLTQRDVERVLTFQEFHCSFKQLTHLLKTTKKWCSDFQDLNIFGRNLNTSVHDNLSVEPSWSWYNFYQAISQMSGQAPRQTVIYRSN